MIFFINMVLFYVLTGTGGLTEMVQKFMESVSVFCKDIDSVLVYKTHQYNIVRGQSHVGSKQNCSTVIWHARCNPTGMIAELGCNVKKHVRLFGGHAPVPTLPFHFHAVAFGVKTNLLRGTPNGSAFFLGVR